MEVDRSLASANPSTVERMTENEHEISQPSSTNTSVEPRKRSHSVLHWMQKTLTNVTTSHAHHEHSSSRQRSATTTQHARTSPPRRSPPVSRPLRQYGRPRSSTMDSINSTNKRRSPPKKIIADTDAKAQQSPSIFQFVFGR